MIIDTTDGELSALDAAIESIDSTDGRKDIPALTRIIAEALPRLEPAEAVILCDHVQDRMEISAAATRALLKGAESYRHPFGVLRTARQVAKVYLDLLEKYCDKVVMVGSSTYTYAPRGVGDDDSKTGFFVRMQHAELIEDITETFDDLPLLRSARGREEVVAALRMLCGNDAFFDDALEGVNLRNGFLQMDEAGNCDLLPHSASQKARMRLEVDYDPDADAGWLDAAFSLALPKPSARMALQEVAGSILFGVRPARDSARGMHILWGASGSGKSTIINMLVGLMPAETVGSVPPEHWKDPLYRAALENVMLNVVTELGTTRLAGEHVKKIVSREPMITREMRRNPVVVTPQAQHLFATNGLPRIDDKTDAFARRINVISFEQKIAESEVDSGLLERVAANPNALIAFAARGAARLRRHGVFTTPPGYDLAIAEMQHGDDPVLLFAHTQVRRDPGARVTTEVLRSALRAFADDRNVRIGADDHGAIRRVVQVLYDKYGATRRTTSGRPFYEGVSLINGSGPDEEDARHDRATTVDLGDL